MKELASRAKGTWRSSAVAATLALALTAVGCVAGELGGGSRDEEDERGIAANDDSPEPFEISQAEFDALMLEDAQEAPPPEPATADLVDLAENEAAPLTEPDGELMITEDSTAAGEDGERQTFATGTVLGGIVGFVQINKTSARGSCGSHAGGVAIAKLLGKKTTAQSRTIETAIYKTVPARPGAGSLVTGYNKYLKGRGSKWRAKSFSSSGSILTYLKKGSPVVANTTQWGGHYVCIYGLSGGTIWFSDGIYTDGVSAKLSSGYLKKWSYSSFLKYAKGRYIGFSR